MSKHQNHDFKCQWKSHYQFSYEKMILTTIIETTVWQSFTDNTVEGICIIHLWKLTPIGCALPSVLQQNILMSGLEINTSTQANC